MNIFQIEKRRGEVLQDLVYCTTSRQKLFVIKDFFALILEPNNPALFEAYSVEFIEIYLSALSSFSPMYMHPSVTEGILEQINLILNLSRLSSVNVSLEKYSNDIREKLDLLKKYLSGTSGSSEPAKLCFPVLEIQDHTYTKIKAGLLETVTIKISKGKRQDKFLIVPLTGNPEEKLSEQIKISWDLALQYLKQHIRKVDKYHEVMIHFDGRLGNYIGYSLGLTLTIGFIEELLNYYNAPWLVSVKNSIALTGGIDSRGKILSVGQSSIETKTETVFNSGTKYFILPRADEKSAEEKLAKLLEEFPERNLELVPVNKLEDLLNRRNLININKQNPVIRTARMARKNYLVVILLAVLLLLVSYYGMRDFDFNPAILENTTTTLFVKNKSGKILWQTDFYISAEMIYPAYLKTSEMLMDVDNDGRNEILLCNEHYALMKDRKKSGRIVCLDYEQKELWDYVFRDTISSPLQILETTYGIHMLDTLTRRGKKIIIAAAKNGPSYASAVFMLDAATGQRLPGTFWHPGFVEAGMLVDYDSDSQKEILCAGINNGFERPVIFGMEVREWNSTAPTTPRYVFYNRDIEDFGFYIMIPNTDFSDNKKFRTSYVGPGGLYHNEKESCYSLISWENGYNTFGITYRLSYNLKDFNLVIDNQFRVSRDTLVARGELSRPMTDTPEYCDILKSQMLYWQGNKFVNYDEYRR